MISNHVKNLIFSLIGLARPIKVAILILLDALVCITSTWLAFYLRTDEFHFTYRNEVLVSALAFFTYMIYAFKFGIHRELTRYLHGNLIALFLKCFLFYGATFFIALLIIQIQGVPKSIGLIQPILFFTLLLFQRSFLRWILDLPNLYIRNQKKKVLIYGAGVAGRQVASAFRLNKLIKIIAFIDDGRDMHGRTIDGLSIYNPSELNKLFLKESIDEIWLAIPSVDKNIRNEIISRLIGRGVKIRTIPDVRELVTGDISSSNIQELDMDDLLGRTPISPNKSLLERPILDRTVLITGAGGSIGSEIVRQTLSLNPKRIVLLDHSEFNLHKIYEESKRKNKNTLIEVIPVLCSVQDKVGIERVISTYLPEIVFHAAAYKHVPLVEENIVEAIKNNTFGTLNCAIISQKYNALNFVLISTDKAVRPTSIMGCTKRAAEMVLQALNKEENRQSQTIFSMVRFGNVLDSSGSVVPLFREQISCGGPITLTHKDVNRYFMTIPEAAQLVIQSAGMSTGGDLFILDMGEPLLIRDLAIRMISLSGLTLRDEAHPEGDLEIKITGLRPGEKLFEELLISGAPEKTPHPKIMRTTEEFIDFASLNDELIKINKALLQEEDDLAREILVKLVSISQKI